MPLRQELQQESNRCGFISAPVILLCGTIPPDRKNYSTPIDLGDITGGN